MATTRHWWQFRTQSSAARGRSTAPRPVSRFRALLFFCLSLTLLLWATLAVSWPGESPLQVDQPSPASIQAPRTVTYTSQLLTDAARSRAENDPENLVYSRDLALPAAQRAELVSLLATIEQIRVDPSLENRERLEQLSNLPNATLVISPELALTINQMSAEGWARVNLTALNLYDRAMAQYNYELTESSIRQVRERVLPYWTPPDLDAEQGRLARLFAGSFLKVNVALDAAATEQRKAEARAMVQPVEITIQRDESVVRQGDLVTPQVMEKLQALGVVQPSFSWSNTIGRGLMALMLTLPLTLYLWRYEQGVSQSPRALLAIGAVILLATGLGRLLIPSRLEVPFIFPIAAVALIMTPLFNGRLSTLVCSLLSLLVGALSDNQLSLTATLLVGSAVVPLVLGRGERSLSFLLTGLVVAGITLLVQLSFYLSQFGASSLERIGMLTLYSALNGAMSAIVALPLLTIVGRIAGFVTPFQLMELAHPSQPLLRRLIREAPGTYYHSVSVGNLAESAAETVDADALLLRVAAYYHDIGKLVRPYFFSDNQIARANVHNELDPKTSAEIIADHVREGVKMAQAARLPRQIIEFIATHHGTSLIKHFYQLAMQQYDSVNVDDFRYPGPLPSSKEQGILMLADSVEATVRSKYQNGKISPQRRDEDTQLVANTGQTVEELVESIVEERIRSGQLDECPLTMRDIARIKQAFTTTLQGIYHPRVEYAPQVVK